MSSPSRVTRPRSGLSVPPSTRSSVVLPEPLAPSTPTRLPGLTSSETPCSPAQPSSSPARPRASMAERPSEGPRAPRRTRYANQTSSAECNTHPGSGKPPRRREAKRLLVTPVQKVADARQDLEGSGQPDAHAGVGDRVAGVDEEAAVGSERRFHIEHTAPRAHLREHRDR